MALTSPSVPPFVLFRTAGARNRFDDRYVSQRTGRKGEEKGSGKKAKSGGLQLDGGPRIWMAYIETNTDKDKKALLRACTNMTKERIGADSQTLWAHHILADRHSGRLLIQLQWDDKGALPIVRADDRIFDKVRDAVSLELQALRPLRGFGWEIRVQKCEFQAACP